MREATRSMQCFLEDNMQFRTVLLSFFAASLSSAVLSGCGSSPQSEGALSEIDPIASLAKTPPGDSDAGFALGPVSAGDEPAPPSMTCSLLGPRGSTAGLALRWNATVPTGMAGASLTPIGTAIDDGGCTVQLGSIQTSPWNVYRIYLNKRDTTPGSCASAKGYRILVDTYETPIAFLAHHPTEPKLFAVAVGYRISPSGSSPAWMDLRQVDWETGDDLHVGVMAVKGSSGGPRSPGSTPTAMAVHGCDLSLDASGGNFPGVTGTDHLNGFTATYTHFLAPEPQAPSLADKAVYK